MPTIANPYTNKRTMKNPYTYDERKEIVANLTDLLKRIDVQIDEMREQGFAPVGWINYVQRTLERLRRYIRVELEPFKDPYVIDSYTIHLSSCRIRWSLEKLEQIEPMDNMDYINLTLSR